MSSAAPSPPEQGQLANVRQRQYVVTEVARSILPVQLLAPSGDGPQHRVTLAFKEALEHGHFGPWLKAEFGWGERTAQNFMSVAERFKFAKIADLPIQPSAAYMLAAPAVPDEARQVAIEKAEAGEEITFTTAKEIVAEAKKKRRPRRQKAVPADKLGLRLVKSLERYKERWNPKELSELARQLREFADALEKPASGGKKTAKD